MKEIKVFYFIHPISQKLCKIEDFSFENISEVFWDDINDICDELIYQIPSIGLDF